MITLRSHKHVENFYIWNKSLLTASVPGSRYMWNEKKMETSSKTTQVRLCFFPSQPNIDQPPPRHLALSTFRKRRDGGRRILACLSLTLFISARLKCQKKIYTFPKKPQATSATMTIRKVLLKNKRNNGDARVTKINTDKHIVNFQTSFLCCIITIITPIFTLKQTRRAIILALAPKSAQRLSSPPWCGQFRGRPSFRLATPRLRSGACWGFLW